MASHHLSELDSGATDSVASSPRSEHHPTNDLQVRMRFMCSFGGKILPRPHDNQLRYVGGDTRMVAVHRTTTFSALIAKLSKLSGITNVTVKYQLPNEDLDALISVTTDEDVENMMEEYDRLLLNQNPRSARLRLFLFPKGQDQEFSRTSSISSLLDGSTNRGSWFFDALNGGSGLERGRSEASSIVSEVPDYLFGLDNSDETQGRDRDLKLKPRPVLNDNVSASDPGSPAPVISSPFCSTSSAVPTMPDLPPVKTKPDGPVPFVDPKESPIEEQTFTEPATIPQPGGYPGNTMWQYTTPGSQYSGPSVQQMPVYYVQGPVPTGNIQVQQPMPIGAQYVQQYPAPAGQVPMGYGQPPPAMGQAYGGGGMRPVMAFDPYKMAGRVGPDGVSPQVYYGVANSGLVPTYSGMVVPGGEEIQGASMDTKMGRVNQSH